MKRKNNFILLAALSLGLGLVAVIAQTVTTSVPGNITAGGIAVRTDDGILPVLPQTFQPVTAAQFFNDKAVKNQPLAAEFQSATVQPLENGANQTTRQTMLVYRDKDGRMRVEQNLPITTGAPASAAGTTGAGAANATVEIYDPVAGFGYTLNAATRTAYRYKLSDKPEAAAPLWDKIPQTIEISSADKYDNNKNKTYKLDKPITDNLGKQTILGIEAHGKRHTVKIPMNAVGNDAETETVHEAWYSNQLKMLVKSSTINALLGEHSFSMTKLARADQPLSLFQVPTNYTTVQMGAVIQNQAMPPSWGEPVN